MSRDRGRSWLSIAGDLPKTGNVWAIEQDHVDPDLLFVGTEFGLFFSPDHGSRWLELAGGVPTISFRDLEIQRRENDLVGATFGRGFYILDDYSPLRSIAKGALDKEASLFPVRDTWWYVPLAPGQAQGIPSLGSSEFVAPNPPFGALITYHLRDTPKTARESRHEEESKLDEQNRDIPFPGWETLRQEALEQGPQVLLTILDSDDQPVRRLVGPAKAGVHRLAWDLRLPPPNPINLEVPAFRPPWAGDPEGPLAPPGIYRVEMALLTHAGIETLGEPREFRVKAIPSSLLAPDYSRVADFQKRTRELIRQASGAARELRRAEDRIPYLRRALQDTPQAPADLFVRLEELAAELENLRLRLQGDRIRDRWEEPSVPSILGRLWTIAGGHWGTRQAPTVTQQESLQVAQAEFSRVKEDLKTLLEQSLPALEAELEAAGAPWTPGRLLPVE